MRLFVLAGLSLCLTCCAANPQAATHTPSAAPLPALSLRALGEHIYLHRSWQNVPELGVFSSNGLLLHDDSEAVLIDTPWTPEDSERLYQEAQQNLGVRIDAVFVTHAHADRVAGLDVLAQHGVESYGLGLTRERALAGNLPAPQNGIPEEGAMHVDGANLQFFFPGAAHAPDNLIVYLSDQDILFGGCMVRALEMDLGNLGDADLVSWRQAIARVIERFPDVRMVVPGHGEPGGPELLVHTRDLLDEKLSAGVPSR